MSNRLSLIMTIIVIACMALLFMINFNQVFWPSKVETYLSYNGVRGVEVEHHGSLYTLNFEQQNRLIDLLNRSIPIGSNVSYQKNDNMDVKKIVIYRFDKPDVILIPYGHMNENIIFLSKDWNSDGLMKDVSQGELKTLLSTTFDH